MLSTFLVVALFGSIWFVIGIAASVVANLWLALWLPRSAHRAFEAARYSRAERRYRILGVLAFSKARERAALLSRAACNVADRRHARAEALLAAVDPAQLDVAERVVWLNNRACIALDLGRDPHAALALVDEATALRPDAPAIQHTRATALLAVGRIDDAIAVLDGMRTSGELPRYLEAQRCHELAKAWEQKGEVAYADDYRQRAAATRR